MANKNPEGIFLKSSEKKNNRALTYELIFRKRMTIETEAEYLKETFMR